MPNILVVEDDENLRILMTLRLKNKYDVFSARDGREALEIIERETVHCVVTDVMMPETDGYTLVQTLRGRGLSIPVIIITAKGSIVDKQRGFAAGTDDYMTKPVNFEELIWRIDALLRRSKIANEGRITVGETVVDKQSFTVTRGEKVYELPTKEFQLLYLLLSYPGKIFTKENILDSVWGYASESDEYTVRTHVNRLRNKFGEFSEFEIITIRGIGYKAVINKCARAEGDQVK